MLPGIRKKGEEFLVSTVRVWVTPQVFWGELGNCCYTSLCCMTVHYWITWELLQIYTRGSCVIHCRGPL